MALIGALAGVALAAVGLFLALGPWALVGSGVAVAVVALLAPTRDPEPLVPPGDAPL